jgi:hypothetical protein
MLINWITSLAHKKYNFKCFIEKQFYWCISKIESYTSIMNFYNIVSLFYSSSFSRMRVCKVSLEVSLCIYGVSHKYPIKYLLKIKIINSDTSWIRIREYPWSIGIRYGYVSVLKYPCFIVTNMLVYSCIVWFWSYRDIFLKIYGCDKYYSVNQMN